MALPLNFNPSAPIPNGPFYSPLTNSLQSVAGPLIVGSGISIDYTTSTINATGGGSGTVTSVATGTGLTGGPITTTGTIALANTAVTAGSYTSANITVDAQGRITAAANGSAGGTVTSVATGTGLTGGPFTTTGTIALANTAVTAGAYTYASLTVDEQGRLVAASNGVTPITCTAFTAKGNILAGTGVSAYAALPVGSNGKVLAADSGCASGLDWITACSGTVTSVVAGTGLSGGTITNTGTIALTDTGVGPGSYTNASFTVDVQGRLTAASNGTQPITCLDFDAKGDLLVGAGSDSFATLGVGTDGQVLFACSTATNGVCWGTAGGASDATPTLRGVLYGCSGTTTTGVGCEILTSLGAGLCNTAVGCSVLSSIVNGGSNTAVGYKAGSSVITNGSFNVVMGSLALGNATATGNISNNTAIGMCTLAALTAGSCNVAVGSCSMRSQTSGGSNVAIGYASLWSSTTGIGNVAIGFGSLLNSATAGFNIGVGYASMQANTTGTCNIGIGICSHDNLEGGCNNVALGFRAGANLSTGCYNVSIGDSVCLASATGSCQLAIGFSGTENWLTGDSGKNIQPGAGIRDCANSLGTAGQALLSTGTAVCWGAAGGASDATPTVAGIVYGCSAADNVSVGQYALQSITSGSSNVAVGCEALCSVTTGISNVAVGRSLVNNTGDQNTAIGAGALFLNTTGGLNTALGNNTMVFNATGRCNTGIGQGALYCNSAGNCNVAVGIGSGFGATGSNNIFLGACSLPSAAGVNNEVDIYNGSVTARFQGAAGGWSFVSDVRDKRNVTALPVGLEFVNDLQPRQFEWDIRDSEVDQGKAASGFIAQEVDAAVESHSAEYLGLVDKNNPEQFTLTQTNLIPVMVKAIQELSAQNKALEARITQLEANG